MQYDLYELGEYTGVWLTLSYSTSIAEFCTLLMKLTPLAYGRTLVISCDEQSICIGYITLQSQNDALRGLTFAYSQT